MASSDKAPLPQVRAPAWLDEARAWLVHRMHAAIDLVYPPICLACEAELPTPWLGPTLCPTCRAQLEPAGEPQCPFCAAPGSTLRVSVERCIHCRGVRWHLTRMFGLGRYSGLRRDCVLRVKDQLNEPLATALGELLAQRFGPVLAPLRLEVVVPIPSHWRRRIEHGGNSPEALAAPVAACLNLPQANDALFRTRRTRPQARLSPPQRWENVRGTFAVSAAYDWTDARVLLVDDILTTGATANEAAKMLRAAGAAEVYIAVVARGVGETA